MSSSGCAEPDWGVDVEACACLSDLQLSEYWEWNWGQAISSRARIIISPNIRCRFSRDRLFYSSLRSIDRFANSGLPMTASCCTLLVERKTVWVFILVLVLKNKFILEGSPEKTELQVYLNRWKTRGFPIAHLALSHNTRNTACRITTCTQQNW